MTFSTKFNALIHEVFWLRAVPSLLGNQKFLQRKSLAETERIRVRYVVTFFFSLLRDLFLCRLNALEALDKVESMRWANMKLMHYMHVNMTPHAKTPAFFDIVVQIPNAQAGHVPFNLVSSRRAGGVGPLEEVESVNNARIFCYLATLQRLSQ